MGFRREADFGPDYEPYLRNLEKKWMGQKLILISAGSFFILFMVFIFRYQTPLVIAMVALCAIMTIGSLFMLNGYRLLTRPKDHYIKKKFQASDLGKLARTKLRKWAEKNKMLMKREAGVYYFYFWYAYAYAPIYYVIKLEHNTSTMLVYYLWTRQYFVVSPQHSNISNPLSPYRVRERELKRDRKVLEELEKFL